MRTLLLVTLLILLSRDCTAQITLPKPAQSGDVSVESALASRRSLRQFSDSAVTLQQLSQLLWAAQGLTSSRGNRTAPSAGGLYPLEVYLVVENVSGLAAGTYRYHPKGHRLSLVSQGHDIQDLASAALKQSWIANSAVVIVIGAVYSRSMVKYGIRARRYVHIEVGHVGQNIYLQAESLGLGATMVGAFDDRMLKRVIGMRQAETPLGLVPVGIPK